MTSMICWRSRLVYPIALLTLAALAPTPARADFFDDARRTFTTDIPHFFQDDIPCAFGGKPTSGTKTSCKSAAKPAEKDHGTADKTPEPGNTPPNTGQ
jgi:hypothetical protein